MKTLKTIAILFVILIAQASCTRYNDLAVIQKVRVQLKNNTNKPVNLWVNDETAKSTNLVAPQKTREKVVSLVYELLMSGSELAKAQEITIYAGSEGTILNSFVASFDYWKKNDDITRDYKVQFNSDGSWSGF